MKKRKEKYKFVPGLNLYRKRDKTLNGGKPIYGKTVRELDAKIKLLHKEAEEKAAREEEEAEREKKPTFASYAAKWEMLYSPHVRPQTADDYHTVIENHILPTLGGMALAEITADDVSEALLMVSHLSKSVYNKTYMLIKMIFDSATEAGVVECSPCPKFRRSGIMPKETTTLTPEEQEILLDAVKGTSADTFVRLALYTGMRVSEILALQWDRVYLRSRFPYIRVERTLRWKNSQAVVSNMVKSEAALRDIPIPQSLLKHLREIRKGSDSAFVIHNSSNGPLKKNQYAHLWHAVVCRSTKEREYTKYYSDGTKKCVKIKPQLGERAAHRKYRITIDFNVTPHGLRRTYITRLIAAGIDPKTVQYLAGHKSARTTMDLYAKVLYDRPEHLIPMVERAFEPQGGKTDAP